PAEATMEMASSTPSSASIWPNDRRFSIAAHRLSMARTGLEAACRAQISQAEPPDALPGFRVGDAVGAHAVDFLDQFLADVVGGVGLVHQAAAAHHEEAVAV